MKRIRHFFEKRMKKLPVDPNEMRNEYYENVSVRFGIAQVVLFLLLFSFVILSFVGNTELITYRNFYYFFKDLNASVEAVDIFEVDSLTYPTDTEQSFALYRKGLAVAGTSSVTVFSATGRQILSVSVNYRNPRAVGTGKYLLVYEAGGTQYSLYNSDVQIHSAKTEYPIYGAEVSDSGKYALITSSRDYATVVSLYGSNFSHLADYNFKNKYVMDVTLDSQGTRIGILCSIPEDGAFSTSLLLAEIGKKTEIGEPQISDSLGISCSFTASGKIAVLCSDSVVYLSDRGQREREKYNLDGLEVTYADVGAYGIVLAAKVSTVSEKSTVIVFDKDGNAVYRAETAEKIGQVLRSGRSVFWKSANGVTRLRLQNGSISEKACLTDGRVLLAVSDDEVLCCSPQKAVYVGFD